MLLVRPSTRTGDGVRAGHLLAPGAGSREVVVVGDRAAALAAYRGLVRRSHAAVRDGSLGITVVPATPAVADRRDDGAPDRTRGAGRYPVPTRLERRFRDAVVVEGVVTAVDRGARVVTVRTASGSRRLPYDELVEAGTAPAPLRAEASRGAVAVHHPLRRAAARSWQAAPGA